MKRGIDNTTHFTSMIGFTLAVLAAGCGEEDPPAEIGREHV